MIFISSTQSQSTDMWRQTAVYEILNDILRNIPGLPWTYEDNQVRCAQKVEYGQLVISTGFFVSKETRPIAISRALILI